MESRPLEMVMIDVALHTEEVGTEFNGWTTHAREEKPLFVL